MPWDDEINDRVKIKLYVDTSVEVCGPYREFAQGSVAVDFIYVPKFIWRTATLMVNAAILIWRTAGIQVVVGHYVMRYLIGER